MAHDFYKTVKVPLHLILINPEHLQILDDTAITVNKIVQHGFEFLQMALKTKLDLDGEFPRLTQAFVQQCLNTVCLPKPRPPQQELDIVLNRGVDEGEVLDLRYFLADVYYERYAGSQMSRPSRSRINHILAYASKEIVTAYSTNIHTHLKKHMKMYVDAQHSHEFRAISEDHNLSGAQKKAAKARLHRDLAAVTSDLLKGNMQPNPLTCPGAYVEFVQFQRPLVMPSARLENNSIKYHAKSNPSSFLRGMSHMSDYLISLGRKSLIVFPRRHDSSPSFCTLCGLGLTRLLPPNQANRVDFDRFSQVFDMTHHSFRSYRSQRQRGPLNERYKFSVMQTDGVTACLKFMRLDLKGLSLQGRNRQIKHEIDNGPPEEFYIEEAVANMAEDEKVRLRNANIVAGDPGMNPLLFMVDSPYPTQKVVTKREYRRVQRRIRPPNQRLHPRGKSSRKYKNRNYRKNRRRRDAALAAAAPIAPPAPEVPAPPVALHGAAPEVNDHPVPLNAAAPVYVPLPEPRPQVQLTISQNYRRKELDQTRHKVIRKTVTKAFSENQAMGFTLPIPPPLDEDGNLDPNGNWDDAGHPGVEQVATVQELESSLSAFNSKTCNLTHFCAYIRAKNHLRGQLDDLYSLRIFRKLKFSTYVRNQQLEANLVQKYKQAFDHNNGERAVLYFGDGGWRDGHMPNHEPVPCIGLRRMFRRHGYQVFLVGERYTSKRCASCESPFSVCAPFRYTKDARRFNPNNRSLRAQVPRDDPFHAYRKKRHNLTRCNRCNMLWDRDCNAASNIWKVAYAAINDQPRPLFLNINEHGQ